MILKPVTSEKAVRLIEAENTLIFAVDRRAKKDEIKSEVEKIFNVKVIGVRTLMRNNTKFAHVRLRKENPAIDVATKLGMI